MKKRDLLKRIDSLEANVDAITSRHAERLYKVEAQCDSLATKYAELLEAVGGAFWRTKNGSTRALIALSSEHLRNIIEVMRPGYPLEGRIKDELQRRTIDQLYRKHAASKSGAVKRSIERAIQKVGGMAPPQARLKPMPPCKRIGI